MYGQASEEGVPELVTLLHIVLVKGYNLERWVLFALAQLVFLIAMGGCIFSQPSSTVPQTILPTLRTPTPTNQLTRSPTPVIPKPVSTPIKGSLESPIFISIPDDEPQALSLWQDWIEQLEEASRFKLVMESGPLTEIEVLEALGSGKIHVSGLSSLAYIFGRKQGWVRPGVMWTYQGQEGTAIMFVARTDSGLVPGNPPDVFRQFEERRPCWPELENLTFPPLSQYILPLGILASNAVKTGPPVYIEGPPEYSYVPSLESAVFLGECDFAAIDALPADSFKNSLPGDLSGVSFEQWSQSMQVLYTTPPINPASALAFSMLLPDQVYNQLIRAILKSPPPFPDSEFRPFNQQIYSDFERIVKASGLDIQAFLTGSPTPSEMEEIPTNYWKSSPQGTVVLDVFLQGGAPFLPFTETGALNRTVLPAIYAELARLDASGQFILYLANALPSRENGQVRFVGEGEHRQLEVEFQLRPGVRWQDGQPLTVEDLVFSWELVMQSDWPGSHWGSSGYAPEAYVDSVEVPQPDRIIYRFMSQRQARRAARDGGRLGDPALYADLFDQVGPVVPLDYLEVGRNVFPRHLLEDIPVGEIAESDFAHRPVYAGAYRLVEGGEADQPIVLESWDGFVLGIPKIERIVFGAGYFSPAAEPYWQTPDKLAEALRVGAIQVQLSFPGVRSREGSNPRAYDALAEEGLANVAWAPRDQWEVLDFNLDNPHLADLRVRQAIAHALDRRAIIEEALAGHGELMRSYLPAWHPLYAGDAALLDFDYDPQQAQALLQEAGYDLSLFPAVHPTRGPLTLRLASMDVTAYPRQGTAELIKEQLAEIGIQVEVQFYEWQEFEGDDCSAIRNGRQFDLGMAGWIVTAPRFPYSFVEKSTASWRIPTVENGCSWEYINWSGWRNERVDQIIPQLKDGRLALEQPEQYRQLWAEHQVLWASELPSLPLFNVQRPVVVVPDLIGVMPSPFAFGGGVEDTWNIFEWIFK